MYMYNTSVCVGECVCVCVCVCVGGCVYAYVFVCAMMLLITECLPHKPQHTYHNQYHTAATQVYQSGLKTLRREGGGGGDIQSR